MGFIVALGICVVFLYCIYLYTKNYQLIKIIDQIPGPSKVPLLGNVLQFPKPGPDLFKYFCEKGHLYRKDNMYRFWLGCNPIVVFLKAEPIRILLTDSRQLTKAFLYDFLKDWLKTGLLLSTNDKWHYRRKILTPAFHFQILNDFVPVFHEHSQILVNCLKDESKSKPIDIYPLITQCTLDIIGETAMGVKLNAQLKSNSHYVQAVHDVGELITQRYSQPWFYIDWIYSMSASGKKYNEKLNILHDFTRKVISERADEMKKVSLDGPVIKKRHLAFLDLLLSVSQTNQALTFEDIQEEVDTFMFEGYDTTASGTTWILYLIGQNPLIQENVYQELLCIFGETNRSCTPDDIKDMKYLECVIKEALRLFPPAAYIARKITENFEVYGKTIPKGTGVMIDIYSLHRDPDVFPDPEKFDPNRFLDDNINVKHPFAYIPFSAGSRNCIGQRFAMMEMKVMVSSVLRHFKIESIQTMTELKPNVLLVLQPGAEVLLNFSNRK